MLAINQDAAGIQARKVLVDGRPLGMPVGVEACTAPDQASLAASAACSSGTASTPPPQSMAEVAAAKQLWQSIPVGGSSGAVQLRSRFYSAAAPCREDGEAGEAGAAGRACSRRRVGRGAAGAGSLWRQRRFWRRDVAAAAAVFCEQALKILRHRAESGA